MFSMATEGLSYTRTVVVAVSRRFLPAASTAPARGPDTVFLHGGQVAIDELCPPVDAKIFAVPGGTIVHARWAECVA
jgi:hypothetical protein